MSTYREQELSHHAHDEPHVISIKVLVGTWLALMVLTGLTVGATAVDLGAKGNLVIALAIAVAKALLVCFIFMHLWFDQKYNLMVFFTSLLFVILFVSVTFIDAENYQDDIRAADEETLDIEQQLLPEAAATGEPADAPDEFVEDHTLRVPPQGKGRRTSPTEH